MYTVLDDESQQPFLDIYNIRVVYNTRVECTIHANYSYTRYLHIYRTLSIICLVKLKVETPPEAWIERNQTKLEGEAW